MAGPGVGRRNAPQVKVAAPRLRGRGDGRPPREVVAHELAARAGPACEEAVGATRMARHQHGGQRLALLRRECGVGPAPRQDVEQQVVVVAAGEMDRLAPLHRGGLTCELGRVLPLLDKHAALDAGANVVAAAVAEGLQELVRRKQLDDARVLRLDRRDTLKALFLHGLAEVVGRLGFDHEPRHARSTRPIDQHVNALRRRRHGSTRHVRLARRACAPKQDGGHRLKRAERDPFDAPARPRLNLAPSPRLEERRRRRELREARVPLLLLSRHQVPASPSRATSRDAQCR